MTKQPKTTKPTPQPLTTHYLETLAQSLLRRGLATTNILEHPNNHKTRDE